VNILNLPNWKVLELKEGRYDFRIVAEYTVPNRFCPHCDSRAISRNGSRPALFNDLPIHGKQVRIEVIRQRYLCKGCGKSSSQRLPDVDSKRDATARLVRYVSEQSLKRTFASIAEEIGSTPNTVRNIYQEYVRSLDLSYKPAPLEWLGIAEIYAIRRPRCVLTNVKERLLLDVLPARDLTVVSRRLLALPDRQRVQVVTVDMWPGYRDAALHHLPQAKIVVDKSDVLRLANQGLDSVRKTLRGKLSAKRRRVLANDRSILTRRHHELEGFEKIILEGWTKAFPVLGQAYALKEGLYNIYDTRDRYEARERYQAWLMSVLGPLEAAFRELISALRNWEPYILAYFDQSPRVVNAYTESINSLIRHVQRDGRGYSFEALRVKLLYNTYVGKLKRPFTERRNLSEDGKAAQALSGDTPDPNDGAEVSTQIKKK
jgi:transposase